MSIEGAMLGGYLLPEEQFVELFTRLLQENRRSIMRRLTDIKKAISNKNIAYAFKLWENFQTDILINPKTELLTIIDLKFEEGGAGTGTWVFANEFETLTQRGRLSFSRLTDMMKVQYTLETWMAHLNNLNDSINKDRLTYDEIMFLWGLKKGTINERLALTEDDLSSIAQSLAEARWGDRDYRYMPIIYGKNNVNARGKIADAFLNHMGKMHKETFSLSSSSARLLDFKLSESVKDEENKTNLGFIRLLLESLNNTPWFTGGDLIVTDENGKVLINIQLKTRDAKSVAKTFSNINYKELNNEIQAIHKMFVNKEENEIIAKRFFKMLKTSTVTENIGDNVITVGYALAEKTLKSHSIIS